VGRFLVFDCRVVCCGRAATTGNAGGFSRGVGEGRTDASLSSLTDGACAVRGSVIASSGAIKVAAAITKTLAHWLPELFAIVSPSQMTLSKPPLPLGQDVCCGSRRDKSAIAADSHEYAVDSCHFC
jgi:hypothetical protein